MTVRRIKKESYPDKDTLQNMSESISNVSNAVYSANNALRQLLYKLDGKGLKISKSDLSMMVNYFHSEYGDRHKTLDETKRMIVNMQAQLEWLYDALLKKQEYCMDKMIDEQ